MAFITENQTKFRIFKDQVKKSFVKFARVGIKGGSKPLGVACATFLSSWPVVLRQLRCLISSILAWHLDKEIPYISSKSPKNNTIYDKNRHTLAKNRLIFCQGAIRFFKLCTGACKYASKRLKADSAAQPRGCSVCFVLDICARDT